MTPRLEWRCPRCEAWSGTVYRCDECGHDTAEDSQEVRRHG